MKKYKNTSKVCGKITVEIDGSQISFYLPAEGEFSLDVSDDSNVTFSCSDNKQGESLVIEAV